MEALLSYLFQGHFYLGISQAQQNKDHAENDAEEKAQFHTSHQTYNEAAHPAEEVLFVGLPQLLHGRQINLLDHGNKLLVISWGAWNTHHEYNCCN